MNLKTNNWVPDAIRDEITLQIENLTTAATAAFAYIGPDATIPTTNLVLNPINSNWVLVGSVSWTAFIDYQDHGRKDTSRSFSGTSDVWSPIPIDFQGVVQGGNIHLTISAIFKDLKTGVVYPQNFPLTSKILGQNPDKAAVKARCGALEHQVIAYKESVPKWCQFGIDNLPSYHLDATGPGGFGIMQLTNFPVPTALQIWDWTQNVDAGIKKYEDGKGTIKQHYANLRAKNPTLPDLTPDQYKIAFYQYYNTGGILVTDFYWVPDPSATSWIANPNQAKKAYGDNAIQVENMVLANTPPTGW